LRVTRHDDRQRARRRRETAEGLGTRIHRTHEGAHVVVDFIVADHRDVVAVHGRGETGDGGKVIAADRAFAEAEVGGIDDAGTREVSVFADRFRSTRTRLPGASRICVRVLAAVRGQASNPYLYA